MSAAKLLVSFRNVFSYCSGTPWGASIKFSGDNISVSVTATLVAKRPSSSLETGSFVWCCDSNLITHAQFIVQHLARFVFLNNFFGGNAACLLRTINQIVPSSRRYINVKAWHAIVLYILYICQRPEARKLCTYERTGKGMSVHVLVSINRGYDTRHCCWFTFSCLRVIWSVSEVRWNIFVYSHGQKGKGMYVYVEVV